MVEITLIELNVEDGSFDANLPFSGSATTGTDDAGEDEDAATATEDDSGGNKGLALLGVLVFLIVATAAVKYLTGEDDDPEVAVEAEEGTPSVTAE
ncbi:hypothetical protein GRX03_07335 [Halovenus sp. WSH3]|uniref:Uncharacterized protein n=1 Tax=Halovenus carboxidivorans TaxID=2692199 RepID=A0A6B0T0M9_9EURY|nr:hypothetical protein [Halovenus carboxidivorans]MXR51415.1 hypothetical protein [Halovenus carboxidivorans]